MLAHTWCRWARLREDLGTRSSSEVPNPFTGSGAIQEGPFPTDHCRIIAEILPVEVYEMSSMLDCPSLWDAECTPQRPENLASLEVS
jgi:hypothetical protein